jgi:hypothetical protein
MSSLVRYVPQWFPGGGFKKKARAWGKSWEDCATIPFKEVSKAFVSPLSLDLIRALHPLHLLENVSGRRHGGPIFYRILAIKDQ